jgi:hypothetical protein
MRHTGIILAVACTEDPAPVSTSGPALFADQQYYPLLEGSSWQYRLDSAGVTGIATIQARMTGTRVVDSLTYAVQANAIQRAGQSEADTQYIRKSNVGIMMSSPGLLDLGSFPVIPGGPAFDIPKEFLILPFNPGFQATWDILNIEFNQIPIFPIYFRVKGRYIGTGDVATARGTLRDCARVTISIEARLPNLENPTDFLNPLVLNERADFYFTRPYGLALVDGSEAVFTLLRGGIPLASTFPRLRQELMDMNIVQPDPVCSW